MWQRMAVWMACVSGSMAGLQAQEFTSWSAPALSTSLLSGDCRLRFEVVSGRIAVRSVHWQTKRRETRQASEGDTHQSLTYFLVDTSLALRYEAVAPDARLVLEVPHCADMSLELHITHDGKQMQVAYSQTPDHVQLVVESPEGKQRFQHPSLWHLLFQQPELSRTYLLPLFSLCRQSWSLERQWQDVRSELFVRADSLRLPSRDQLMAWVRQLSSPRRQDRCTAMKQLQGVGQPLIAFLQSLDESQLDREQRYYLARLRSSLVRPVTDTPQSVAAMLVGDPRIWTALTYDADVQTRTLAARQLSRLTGQPVATEDYAISK